MRRLRRHILRGDGFRAVGVSVGAPGPWGSVAHHAQKHAFAKAAIRHDDVRRGPERADGLVNGAARQHEGGAIRADAGVAVEALAPQATEQFEGILRFGRGEADPIDHGPAIALEIEGDAGERGDGAAGAEEADAAEP